MVDKNEGLACIIFQKEGLVLVGGGSPAVVPQFISPVGGGSRDVLLLFAFNISTVKMEAVQRKNLERY